MLLFLQGLKLLAPVVRKLGPNANPAKLKEVPVQSLLVWAFYAGAHPRGHLQPPEKFVFVLKTKTK